MHSVSNHLVSCVSERTKNRRSLYSARLDPLSTRNQGCGSAYAPRPCHDDGAYVDISDIQRARQLRLPQETRHITTPELCRVRSPRAWPVRIRYLPWWAFHSRADRSLCRRQTVGPRKMLLRHLSSLSQTRTRPLWGTQFLCTSDRSWRVRRGRALIMDA